MSIWRCDIHGYYDTDYHTEGCPKCVEVGVDEGEPEEDAATTFDLDAHNPRGMRAA